MLTNTPPTTQATLITIRLPTITNAKMSTTPTTTLRPMKTSTWAPSSKIQRACMVVGTTQKPRPKVNRLANKHLPRPSHQLLLSPRKSLPNQHLSQNLPIPSKRNPPSPKSPSQKNPSQNSQNSQRKNQQKSQRKRSQKRSSQRRLQLIPPSSPSPSLARKRPMSPRSVTHRPQSRSRPSPRRRELSSMRRSRTATWRSS